MLRSSFGASAEPQSVAVAKGRTHPGFDERVQPSEQASANWPGKARPLDLDWKQFRAQFRMIR
jgi:hypothetical protein